MLDSPVGNFAAVEALGNIPASSQRPEPQFRSEAELEAAIEAAKQRMCEAPEREGKLRYWREMCRLIDKRSIHYVRFLERMRGLA
jgi:hypothetical protein